MVVDKEKGYRPGYKIVSIEEIKNSENAEKCAAAIEERKYATIILRDGKILPLSDAHTESDFIDENRLVEGKYGGCSNLS